MTLALIDLSLAVSHSVRIDLASNTSVQGNLTKSKVFWKNILNASDFVMSLIESGYAVSFSHFPTSCHYSNNRSALKHPTFVSYAIKELLKKSCIKECQSPPHCVNPSTVAQGKKLRLFLDLRHINKILVIPKFHYKELRSLAQVFDQGY